MTVSAAPAATFGLSRIGQIAVRVHDVERATAFYRDRLGMRFLFSAPNLAFFQCGEVRLMLGGAESAEFDHPSSVIYYKVDDIDAAYETLKSRGVTFRGEPHLIHRAADHELWMAFFHDADENTLALMSEKRS
ncbi:MAG TPA: VOC family protein [Gemmatimonadaceae bacterium]|nr:VOC family protein [Gemmatimonadaceae bacterium]